MVYTDGQDNSEQDIKDELSRLSSQYTLNKTIENRNSLITFLRNEIENLFKIYQDEALEVDDSDLKAIIDEVVFGGHQSETDLEEPNISLPVTAIKTWQAPTLASVKKSQQLGLTQDKKQRVLLCFRGDTREDMFEKGFTPKNLNPNEEDEVLAGAYHVRPGNVISLTSSLNSAAIFALYTSGADRSNDQIDIDTPTGWVYLIASKHAYNIATDSIHIKRKDKNLFNMTISDYLNESVTKASITPEEIICAFKVEENNRAQFTFDSAFPEPPEGDFIITEMKVNPKYQWTTEDINTVVNNYLKVIQDNIKKQTPIPFYLGKKDELSYLAGIRRAELTQIAQKEIKGLEGIVAWPEDTSERKEIVDIAKCYELTFHYNKSFNEKPYYTGHLLRTYSDPDWAIIETNEYPELKIELSHVLDLRIQARTIQLENLDYDKIEKEIKALLNHPVTIRSVDQTKPFELRGKILSLDDDVITFQSEEDQKLHEYDINAIDTIKVSPEDNPKLEPYFKKTQNPHKNK